MSRRNPRRRGAVTIALGAVLLVAAVFWGVVYGPDWYRHSEHPLSFRSSIAAAARAEKVDPYVIAAMINVESGFRATVTSSAGAVGLMQVLPSTAKSVGRHLGLKEAMTEVTLKDPDTNIRVGTAYYAELLDRYHGVPELALAAYNAGISNADGWSAKWPTRSGELSATIDFPETAAYVGEVLAQVKVYRELYPDAFGPTAP